MTTCVNTCLCENCRVLTRVDCEYFPRSKGRCEHLGTTECNYYISTAKNRKKAQEEI